MKVAKKKGIIIAAVIFCCMALKAQVTEVVSGVEFPHGLILKGNDLYFSVVNLDADPPPGGGRIGNISKIDITASTPTTSTDVIKELNSPQGLLFNGNDLYITHFNDGRISKVDITSAVPEITDVVLGLANINRYYGLALNGNDLYFSDLGEGAILKIDITDPVPATPELVLEGLEFPTGIAVKDNELYIADVGGGKIFKIDLLDAIPTTAIEIPTGANLGQPESIAFNGNDLYIADSRNGKIIKIDVSSPNQGVIEVLTGLDEPLGLTVVGDYLYFSEFTKISKLNLATLSIETPSPKQNVVLYPNPSSNYIHISGLTKTENYKIYNVLGAEISSGEVSKKATINIQNLANGLYFLKFENGTALKFNKKT